MTRLDMKIETCGCQVCRSDLAYIIPCLASEHYDAPVPFLGLMETERPAMVEVFPIPLVM